MTEAEKKSINYRFGGYQPPLIQIGGNTDPGYWIKSYTHPYYENQPQSWKGASFSYGGVVNYGPVNSQAISDIQNAERAETENLYPFIDVC